MRQTEKPRDVPAAPDIRSDRGEREITLSQEAYNRIRLDILRGHLTPGSPLRLEALKSRFGLGFSPLREALNRLSSEKLVVSSALRGFRVADISLAEMWDALNARILIDTEALRLAIEQGDEQWEGTIVASLHTLSRHIERARALDRPLTDEEDDLLEDCHRQFHNALIAACGSRWLTELSALLYTQTERYRRPFSTWTTEGAKQGRDMQTERQSILDAVLDRDVDKATDLLRTYYHRTGDTLEFYLERKAAAPKGKKR